MEFVGFFRKILAWKSLWWKHEFFRIVFSFKILLSLSSIHLPLSSLSPSLPPLSLLSLYFSRKNNKINKSLYWEYCEKRNNKNHKKIKEKRRESLPSESHLACDWLLNRKPLKSLWMLICDLRMKKKWKRRGEKMKKIVGDLIRRERRRKKEREIEFDDLNLNWVRWGSDLFDSLQNFEFELKPFYLLLLQKRVVGTYVVLNRFSHMRDEMRTFERKRRESFPI